MVCPNCFLQTCDLTNRVCHDTVCIGRLLMVFRTVLIPSLLEKVQSLPRALRARLPSPSHFPPPTNSEEMCLGICLQSPLLNCDDGAHPNRACFHLPRTATVAYRADATNLGMQDVAHLEIGVPNTAEAYRRFGAG